MNFKIILIIYLQLIYTSLANFKLTSEDLILPTTTELRSVDMIPYNQSVVNDTYPLVLTFKFEAKDNLYEKEFYYSFNDAPIDFKTRKDVKSSERQERGQKLFSLNFTKLSEKIAGQYKLKIVITNGSTVTAIANIFSPPFLHKFLESKRSSEGAKFEVTCAYTAHPQTLDDLSWRELRKRENPQYRLISYNDTDIKNVIIWDSLKKDDAGYYRCDAVNKYGSDTVILQLRVKDRLASLWPSIGIVIELIILFTIIIFYERQKCKKTAESADANPTRQSLLADTKSPDTNKGARHRNSPD